MSDTPRTDSMVSWIFRQEEWIEFAKKLERENNRMRVALEEIAEEICDAENVQQRALVKIAPAALDTSVDSAKVTS